MATHSGRRVAAERRRLLAEAAERGEVIEAEVRPAARGKPQRPMPAKAKDLAMALAALATDEEKEAKDLDMAIAALATDEDRE